MINTRDRKGRQIGWTYSLILDLLGLAALQRDPVALMLEALGRDQSLDLGSLRVRLLTIALGLDLTADNILSDLLSQNKPAY